MEINLLRSDPAGPQWIFRSDPQPDWSISLPDRSVFRVELRNSNTTTACVYSQIYKLIGQMEIDPLRSDPAGPQWIFRSVPQPDWSISLRDRSVIRVEEQNIYACAKFT